MQMFLLFHSDNALSISDVIKFPFNFALMKNEVICIFFSFISKVLMLFISNFPNSLDDQFDLILSRFLAVEKKINFFFFLILF